MIRHRRPHSTGRLWLCASFVLMISSAEVLKENPRIADIENQIRTSDHTTTSPDGQTRWCTSLTMRGSGSGQRCRAAGAGRSNTASTLEAEDSPGQHAVAESGCHPRLSLTFSRGGHAVANPSLVQRKHRWPGSVQTTNPLTLKHSLTLEDLQMVRVP